MISELKLKFDRSPQQAPEAIPVTPVTVFVGPNNSGKSKALREIQDFCCTGRQHSSSIIIDNIKFIERSVEVAELEINSIRLKEKSKDNVPSGHILIGSAFGKAIIDESQLRDAVCNPQKNTKLFCTGFLAYKTIILDGQGRMQLLNNTSSGDLQDPGHGSLQVLFRNDNRREEVRRIVYEAFGFYFAIDPTDLGNLRVRFSGRSPSHVGEERGIDSEAVSFHANGKMLGEVSDGVKAFAGIICELLAGDPKILLIDEPEAFLHPPLAFRLGQEVSKAASTSEKRVFISGSIYLCDLLTLVT